MSIAALDVSAPSDVGPAGQGDDELRNLKQAVKSCFPAVDGEITNDDASGDPGDTNPPDALTFSNLFARLKALETGVGVGQVGELKWFYCAFEDIPAGWQHCNGTGGSPDFRERHLINANSTTGLPTNDGAATGGSTPSATVTGSGGGHTHGGGGTGLTALSIGQLPTALTSAIALAVATFSEGQDHSASSAVAAANVAGAWPKVTTPVEVTGPAGNGHLHSIDSVSGHTHTIPAIPNGPWASAYLCIYLGI